MPAPYDTIAAEASAFLSFTDPNGIALSRHETANYLELEEAVAYPERELGTELQTLLLEGTKIGVARRLELPANFVTMSQALNDAIGDNTSDHAKERMKELFGEVGEALGRVALHDRKVPINLDYKHLIFSREEEGVKLLPPIEFRVFDLRDEEQAKRHVIDSLYASLEHGAANTTQRRHVGEVFAGFIKGFDW